MKGSIFNTAFLLVLVISMGMTSPDLPTIASATYTSTTPSSGSTNSATTVRVEVPSTDQISELHLLVVTASNDTLVDKDFDATRSLTRSLGSGYAYSLRFFSDVDLSTATISVSLVDASAVKGPSFVATAE